MRLHWRQSTAGLVAIGGLALLCAPGWGATSTTSAVQATVDPGVQLIEPTAVDAFPPATRGARWTVGSPSALSLGRLSGQVVGTASLTWKVTSNNATGYELQLRNTRAAGPVLQAGDGTPFPDMGATPGIIDPTHTQFGIAMGTSSANHDQSSVDNVSGAPWGSSGSGGSQGTIYRGIPAAGMVIATEPGPVANDPVTMNFAANLSATDPLAPNAFTGTVRLTATTL